MRSNSLSRVVLIALGAVLAGTLVAPANLSAQGFADRLKKKAEEAAKRKIEQRTERKAGEATDAALDRAECAIPGTTCETGSSGDPATGAAAAKSARMKPGEGAWKNFDFVPGERVIFAEDFSGTDVGDFPKRLRFESGNIEIVEWNDARYLSTNAFGSRFSVPLPETLPERFTLELEYSAAGGNGMEIHFADPAEGGHAKVVMGTWFGGLAGGGIESTGKPSGDEYKYKDVVLPVRIMADGNHVKVYMGDTRVANVPNAKLGRAKAIWFVVPGREDRAAMIGDIRVAAGGREMYDEIAEKGRVSTRGILFGSGSDRIRPESTPTLKEIGAMLKEHADLRLTIEGHTDDVGEAKANQSLSEQRAAAVKAFLVKEYGIDASRLEAKGLGASRPAASNRTAEGRRQNRRVELARM